MFDNEKQRQFFLKICYTTEVYLENYITNALTIQNEKVLTQIVLFETKSVRARKACSRFRMN